MTEARIIDGKAFAADLRGRIGAAVEHLRTAYALVPGLAVVLVGENPASQLYVKNKGEQTREAGMHSVTHRLPVDTTQEQLLRLIGQLNADPSIHGILVQLPLPPQIDPAAVLAAIDPDKDVDGFHVVNAGRLAVGLPGLVPCTPLGCLMLLKDVVGDLRGLNAVVVGRSNIVGKPMANLLLQANATVTVAHSHTVDLPEVCRGADILIAAVGRPEMIRGSWIKEGAIVIDVGINRVPARDPAAAAAGKTRVVGDVAFEEAKGIAGAITPVPGGVGPMTIACLLLNTLTAACRSKGITPPDDLMP
ncbi:bifunctional methylenetetrahydrofolate dehydrogenase/methenyltetrahydrofolate cyclohydrolase FolD [Rhodospirillum centenum]|uniref:Bifunctional protein FolD n=1 Tax=Rhodospirillum centenum (strain ATCC 51521 / SW) TaxID=414684 RepID=FOLD_RHOCS|nr:bifunctional methylenetetrahydrofolate dehydrogenase/methenyltetrahydrofolate cyclohydrolase FolD [Rhodospirillum centenum]B6IVC0.1 RecName: Full=Bifunctional protein FolD; Includes: RecName: Full=Methylenetetrahydrofolate dehydrogenase; Includes: RecName: Full=Methenyltetrahydrofolate cyclohydrolase [Rhodospirillum centenum SW]ACJ00244.1 FolD bifunctional protein [Rhodospirillum centenum SW]